MAAGRRGCILPSAGGPVSRPPPGFPERDRRPRRIRRGGRDAERRADAYTVSPVFVTASKPGYGPSLGPRGLRRHRSERVEAYGHSSIARCVFGVKWRNAASAGRTGAVSARHAVRAKSCGGRPEGKPGGGHFARDFRQRSVAEYIRVNPLSKNLRVFKGSEAANRNCRSGARRKKQSRR